MRRVDVLVPKDLIGNDDRNRLAVKKSFSMLSQDTVLHGAGMRRGDQALALAIRLDRHEGVVVVAGGMTFGEVERPEHVESSSISRESLAVNPML